jgi:hypothetical protein
MPPRIAGLLAIALAGCEARTRFEIGTFIGERAAAFELGAILVLAAVVAVVAWRLVLASRRRRKAIDAALGE